MTKEETIISIFKKMDQMNTNFHTMKTEVVEEITEIKGDVKVINTKLDNKANIMFVKDEVDDHTKKCNTLLEKIRSEQEKTKESKIKKPFNIERAVYISTILAGAITAIISAL